MLVKVETYPQVPQYWILKKLPNQSVPEFVLKDVILGKIIKKTNCGRFQQNIIPY